MKKVQSVQVTNDLINSVIGELVCMEKYTFADKSLIGEAVRDAMKIIASKSKGDKPR